MKKAIYWTYCILTFGVMGCTNSAEQTDNTKAEEVIESVEKPVDEWGQFWGTFQAAVKNKDVSAVKKLCIWGESFDEAAFADQYEMYFNRAMRDFISSTSAKDVPLTPDAPINTASEVRTLQLMETGEADGEIYESALMLYFGQKDGQFGLVNWMAAG